MEIGGKTFKLGKTLDDETRDQIVRVISKHLDAFAWSASDMPGIDPDFLSHHLAMDPQVKPVRQRRRKFNEERRQAIKEETQKLLAAGHIKEVQYPEWLANVVLVKKSNGRWRMCVNFTDLNKACPKDSFPLPSIDALVDSAVGCKLLSFLDAFAGYNQIKMHPMDEEKTAFMTESAHAYAREERASLCRRHGRDVLGEESARCRSRRAICYNSQVQAEAKPREVHFRRRSGKVFGFPLNRKRNRSES